MTLHLDFETYSSVDIRKAGAFAYTLSEDFEILLCGYCINGEAVKVLDLTEEKDKQFFDTDFANLIFRPDTIISAYNASFEALCLARYFGVDFTPDYCAKFRDTMLHGLYCGYTAGLEATGNALGLDEDKKKLTTGKALIRYFCGPCRATRTNGGRTRNMPRHDPEKWELFKEYNAQDVVTEMEIERRLSRFPVPDSVQKQWEADLRMNARGVYVDMNFVEGALELGQEIKETLTDEAVKISGLDNPNSVAQLTAWFVEETGEDVQNLRKETVSQMLSAVDDDKVKRMLEIRQELGKTSTKKYDALQNAVCPDGRVRGLLQFYGASRTGRWAGRLVQVQNLPRTYIEPIEPAREFVKDRKLNALRWVYGSPNDTLSQLIRTAFVASPGHVLIDADFSAIEARVIAWLAGEEWRLDVFRTHGKIYEASASQMFGVPFELIKKGNPEYELRQRGKVAELALGYQGSVGAMRTMDVGHKLDDLSDDDVAEIVNRWRETNPKIRELWWRFNDAATRIIQQGGQVTVQTKVYDPDRARENERLCDKPYGAFSAYFNDGPKIVFAREYSELTGSEYMTILLPSGRKLFYTAPQIGKNRFGSDSITYYGVDQTTKKWRRIETYGGKLVENVVQAIARDCLAEALARLEAANLPVIFHVHDEVVIDVKRFDSDENMLKKVVRLMAAPISWAPGLPLNADGWVGTFFKKD